MQRQPRLHDPQYLVFLRGKPCSCGCGRRPPSEAAHVRIGWFATQMKPHDYLAVPLNAWCHRLEKEAQHNGSEVEFWEKRGLDPFEIAGRYYDEYGGTGGKPKAPRKIKPRKPKEQRAKIRSRGFPKVKRRFRS